MVFLLLQLPKNSWFKCSLLLPQFPCATGQSGKQLADEFIGNRAVSVTKVHYFGRFMTNACPSIVFNISICALCQRIVFIESIERPLMAI
ncbi:hypothetical protein AMR76_07095 [Vibrio furnissii]|uniref:Uncharacterized protein n=1 Tax=Vibrio furnissii TaxID=29494 RepID=A0A0Q2N4P0_VIBFU|nr:hypothetical protein AMR76_07095 [Vibrio furnissii]